MSRGAADKTPRVRRSLLVSTIALTLLSTGPGAGTDVAGASAAPPEAARAAVGRTVAVLPGIDVWRQRGFAPLTGRRVGLITNQTGVDARGVPTVEILATADRIELVALFSPEHGFRGVADGTVASTTDPETGLPIHSLYGETRRPTAAMLEDLDGLVFDIQDIGTRFYTYATTMAYAMEEAAAHGLDFVVLDRPNPIDGTVVQGPVLSERMLSFVGYAPLPLRHGMTMGELARYFNDERGIGADLTVVPVAGWSRDDWYDATGLLWIDPSPNIRNLTQATLYPGVGPLETTNVSVGRGTDTPFEWFGAPWIDALALAERLDAAELPGVRFLPRSRTPDSSVFAGEICHGVDLLLVDRERFEAGRTAIALATSLWALHGETWEVERFARLWGRPEIVEQIRSGAAPERIARSWEPDLEAFLPARARALIY